MKGKDFKAWANTVPDQASVEVVIDQYRKTEWTDLTSQHIRAILQPEKSPEEKSREQAINGMRNRETAV